LRIIKIGITGSQTIKDIVWLRSKFDEQIQRCEFWGTLTFPLFIFGDAKGVDTILREYALSQKFPEIWLEPAHHSLKKFPNLKIPYNKYLYLARDIQVVDNCDELWAFWDGKSTGTKFTMDYAKRLNKNVKISKYRSPQIKV